MATKRLLSKVISISTKVNALDIKHSLIFTWIIPHCDDYGLITNNPAQLKALVVPMREDITIQDIENFIIKAENLNLVKVWSDCLEIIGWTEHQYLTPSKMAKTRFKKEIPQNFLNSPKISTESCPKIREDKIREDKIREDNNIKADALKENIKIDNGFVVLDEILKKKL